MFLDSGFAHFTPGVAHPFFPPGVVPRSRRSRLANLVVGLLGPLPDSRPLKPAPDPVKAQQDQSIDKTESCPTEPSPASAIQTDSSVGSTESSHQDTVTMTRQIYDCIKQGLLAIFERFPDARTLFLSFNPNSSPPATA